MSHDNYPSRSERERIGTANAVAKKAGSIARREQAESAPFNWGPGGITKLAQELRASEASEWTSLDDPKTRRGTGNTMATGYRALATHDLNKPAGPGTLPHIARLDAVVVSEKRDIAWAIVTQELNGEHTFGVVELGFGSNNESYEGRRGIVRGLKHGLEDGLTTEWEPWIKVKDSDTLPIPAPEAVPLEIPDVFRANWSRGQIDVQTLSEPGDLSVVSYGGATQGVRAMVDILDQNSAMWNLQGAQTHRGGEVLLGATLTPLV